MGRNKIEMPTVKKVVSWRLEASVVSMLSRIADHDGESQASVIRRLIKDEGKRLKIKTG